MRKSIAVLTAVFVLMYASAYAAPAPKAQSEEGGMFMYSTLIGAVAVVESVSSGILFGSSNPTGSAFFLAINALTVYSNMHHVKRDFREKKAINELGYDEATVKAMTDEALLDAIRDDAPGVMSGSSAEAFLDAGMLPRLGG